MCSVTLENTATETPINKVKMHLNPELKKIRLSDYDLNSITTLFCKYFLKDDRLWIFGSRVNLSKKGGDIDLYIETYANDVNQAMNMKSDFLWELEHQIGEQKIDIVINMINNPHPLLIHDVARAQGIQLV